MARKQSTNSGASLSSSFEIRDKYSKPNFLISAKYRTTLLESQIQAISLAHIDHFQEDEKGVLIDELKASDIREILGGNKGSFYKQLAVTADLMTQRNIGVIKPDTNEFDFMSIIIRARYQKGKFYIHYNPYIKDYIIDIKNKFTPLSLEIMLSFKSIYTFRLYELIKAQCFYRNLVNGHDNKYQFRFSLAELKLDMGVINANEDSVMMELKHKKNPDYERAVAISKEKKLEKWAVFERVALKPAVEEINSNKTGMHVDYYTVQSGRGGKVVAVIFSVELQEEKLQNTNEVITSVDLTDDEIDDFLDELRDLIEEKIKTKDLKAIAEAANYNMSRIEEKYEMSKTQNIDNLVAWMISAIKNDYSSPIGSAKSSSPKTTKKLNDNWNITDNGFDYDENEDFLLDN